MCPDEALLHGWGRTSPSRADVIGPRSAEEVVQALAVPPSRGLLPRGLGRSYGDAAQNAGGLVLDMTRFDRLVALDEQRGVATVQAGMSIGALIRELLPRGWFPPVVPGTRHVTVGGAIAADVHGKNHHAAGAFCRHVERMRLVTPTAEVVEARPGDDAFEATAGGMGLTGVVVEASIALLPLESASVRVDTERHDDLDSLMAAMSEGDHRYRYSVAWIDCLARGAALGRGVLKRGDHAPASNEPDAAPAPPANGDSLAIPRWAPGGLLSRPAMRVFNEVIFRRTPRRLEGELQSIPEYFHPLDRVPGWNRLYGPRGLVQHQSVVPQEAGDVLRRMLERVSGAGAASFLAVLKRFGPEAGLISFPRPGWTLALDVPAALPGLERVLDALDELVAEAGGRVYLAKDGRLRPELLEPMYPQLGRWRAIQSRLDPGGIMQSDLARRLALTG